MYVESTAGQIIENREQFYVLPFKIIGKDIS